MDEIFYHESKKVNKYQKRIKQKLEVKGIEFQDPITLKTYHNWE